MYFGDGIRADIVPAKKYADWDTVYIYEEMETELGQKVRGFADVNRTNRTSEDDNEEPIKKKLKVDEESNGQTAKSQVHAEKYRLKNIGFKFHYTCPIKFVSTCSSALYLCCQLSRLCCLGFLFVKKIGA